MPDAYRLALSIVAASMRAAIKGIDAELNAKPQRQPILYRGCSQPINTRERFLQRKQAR